MQTIALPRNSRLCTSINCLCLCQSRRLAHSTSLLPSAAKAFSMVRRVAPRATFRRYSRNQVGTCIKAEEIGIDDFQAKRGPDDRYVTAKLRALWDTKKIHRGGFYHDGRFATLTDVVAHYDNHLQTNLTEQEKMDLIEYLKSI
ncbi:MAG: hypothetical protein ABSA62_15245 [Methyloceanibacter sp.]